MTIPSLTVTGRMGACGNTNRTPSPAGSSSSGTIGSKSWPSAPSPCIQMMAARGSRAVSISTVSSKRPLRDRLALRADVVDQHVLAQALRRGEEGPPTVDPGHLLDEG